MIKVVITAAGKGTRLLPFTKEMPKEMMPIFSNVFTNKKVVLPWPGYSKITNKNMKKRIIIDSLRILKNPKLDCIYNAIMVEN